MSVQSFTLQVAQRGLITLPQKLRKAYDIRPGQEMTLVDRIFLDASARFVSARSERLFGVILSGSPRVLCRRAETAKNLARSDTETLRWRSAGLQVGWQTRSE